MTFLPKWLAFLKGKEVVIANAIIAMVTIGGQQLFSFFTFSCPCHVGQNLIYGLAFLGVPALILLIVGYALNNQTWRLVTGKRSLEGQAAPSQPLQCKLVCFVLCSITGRALVAPVTWLAVTLINGSYYVCAVSEYVPVHYYEANPNITASEHRRILAVFPCSQLVPPELTRARDEVVLLLRYQSQVAGWLLIAVVVITVFLSYCLASCFSPLSFLHFKYWSSYVHNEQELFDEATDQHSRLYAMQHVRKFFGFAPGSENVKEIRIPSLKEWQAISGLAFLKRVDAEHYDYSLLHDWALKGSANGKYLKTDEDTVIRTQV
ncbi:calcium homeostasis modulator protein 4 [Melopsittacus undulatus]|uniref:calcium homeostasis modulator protein 4 n=1 Tax=Melopsittacus undulatus TaxID=13146 RepID=UPI0003835473|nr:calcium homeostasis modulator protein 4 [Melopsittacus undulatus]